MSVLEEVLEEEYFRSYRLLERMGDEFTRLPKGAIRARRIKGHEYFYLTYRDGDKVRTDYVPVREVEELRKKIERRKVLAVAMREQRQSQKQIVKALGRVPNLG